MSTLAAFSRRTIKRLVMPTIDRIVYASGAYRDLKSQTNTLATALITFDRPPSTEADARLLEALEVLRPTALGDGARLVRVGADHDGGYVMLDRPAPDVALSIGVGGDVSWDAELARRGARVHAFDHTVRGLPQRAPGVTFHRLGVGAESGGELLSLDDLAARAGVRDGVRAVLKMDVEGAEWDALRGPSLGRFEQIVVELHHLGRLRDPEWARRILDVLQGLSLGHHAVHLHANGHARVVQLGSYWFPDVVEATFVARSLGLPQAPATRLHTELDRPAQPGLAEIDLGAVITVPAAPRRTARC